MTKEKFIEEHAKICSKQFRPTSYKRNPAARRYCGKSLYEFLTKNNLPLDVYFNQKSFNPNK